MKALLIVDIQNDFLPGGPLAVNEGNLIISVVNKLMKISFGTIVATKDWHPSSHGSFADNHEGKKVGDHINLGGLDQVLWPRHCVQESTGAEFAKDLNVSGIDKIIFKGTNPLIDSYSTFYDNGHRQSTELDRYLRERGVTEIYIAGLATDYCVKYSALDALSLGYTTFVIVDACRGVNLSPNDSQMALDEVKKMGAHLIQSSDLL